MTTPTPLSHLNPHPDTKASLPPVLILPAHPTIPEHRLTVCPLPPLLAVFQVALALTASWVL